MSGYKTCIRIMKRLPNEFSLYELNMAIKIEAGMEQRTISKYIKNLMELKWIKQLDNFNFSKSINKDNDKI